MKSMVRKKFKFGVRRCSNLKEDENKSQMASGSRVILGQGASSTTLGARACPSALTPKRSIPMEVDQPTPSKKKKVGRKNSVIKLDPSQPSMLDMLRKQEKDREIDN